MLLALALVTAAAPREPGDWRMETIAGGGTRELPHALSIGRPAETRAREGAAGAHFVFPDGAGVAAFPAVLPASYRVASSGPARHCVAGLPPDAEINLETGSGRRKARVNSQGVLQFDDGIRGARTIRLSR